MSRELASESYRGPADTAAPAEGGPSSPGPLGSTADESQTQAGQMMERLRSVTRGGAIGLGGGAGGGHVAPGAAPEPEMAQRQQEIMEKAKLINGFVGRDREEADEVWDGDARHGGSRARLGVPSRYVAGLRFSDQLAAVRSVDLDLYSSRALSSGMNAAPNEPRRAFSSTGAWLSTVRTDENGRATVELQLPDNITAWRLLGRGVTQATDVGDAEASLVTKKDLVVDVNLPLQPVEGDRVMLRMAGRDTTGAARAMEVESSIHRDGERLDVASLSGEPGPDGVADQTYGYRFQQPGRHEVRASARIGDLQDELVLQVMVRQFGVELVDGVAGQTGRRAVESLRLSADRDIRDLALRIWVGPDPSRDLVRIALGQGYQPWNCRIVMPTVMATAARGSTAFAVLDALGDSSRLAQADRLQLKSVGEQAVRRLLTMQRRDGGWSWVGKQSSDPRSTSAVLRLFLKASAEGVTGLQGAITSAGDQLLRQLRTASGDVAADILWALAAADRAAFEQLNRVHRERSRLTSGGQARLALAWLQVDRSSLAGELRQGLMSALQDDAGGPRVHSVESMALALRALMALDPRQVQVQSGLARLRAQQLGSGWGTPEATLAAVEALLSADAEPGSPVTPRLVVVTVNGQELARLDAAAVQQGDPILVAADQLRQGDNRVGFEVQGGGVAHYHAVLTGLAPGFSEADRNAQRFWFRRAYLAANRTDGDQVLRPGFSTVTGREVKRFNNPVTNVAVGEILKVESDFAVRNRDLRQRIGPIVIEEPIPAGCAVVAGSLAGSFAHSEIGPGRIVLYYPAGNTNDTFRYQLEAVHQGEYRALPTRLVGALRPEFVGYGETGNLAVRARGSDGGDPYRWTPDELFQLANKRFKAGDLAAAGKHLDELLAQWSRPEARLNDRTYKEVARMMLFVAIERNDSPAVVRFFEELKNRYPDYVVPFDRIVRVGDAYRDIGEHEAALLVFQAAAEASFLKDAAVAQVLESQGEQIQAVRFLERLLEEYPDLNTMRMSHYGLAQQLAARAAALPSGPAADPKIGSQAELRGMALAALRECQILFPQDPLAEEIAFAEATTFLEAGDLDAALGVARRALRTHSDSAFVDEYLYTQGYALFALGKHDEAFDVLRRVAEEQFPRPRGGRGPSESREHAIYLQGQIHHARGEAAEALAAYAKVEDRFSDASEARDYFLHKRLGMPEITSVAPDAPVRFELTHRNLETVELKVFKVDLMRLYLLQKSLDDIRGVQLQGIAPTLRKTVELGDGRDYRDRTSPVDLELDGSGAWLVVARSGSEMASGLILRTSLELDIQEDTPIGRLRVNVKARGAFQAKADVRVVASGDQRIRSGLADLRGVFVADNLVGTATVIARVGGEYAFFRGKSVHQPGIFSPPAPKPQRPVQELQKQRKGGRFDALEQNFLFNNANRARQQRWLNENVIQNDQKGVEVQRTR